MPEQQKNYIQNMSLVEIIRNMPEEQRIQLLEQFSEKIEPLIIEIMLIKLFR